MHVKKSLMLWAVVFALALPLMLVGTASAVYLPDGAVQNATTGGWDMPADMGVCVTGIAADGTLTVDATILSRPDCLAKTFPAYATNAACGNTANADGAHFWASTCVANDGTAISLTGLDRTATMCNQAAIKAGKTSGTWASACTSSWTYMGPSGAATEGFCYAKANLVTAYTTTAACPSSTTPPTPGYAMSGGVCTHSWGITGYASAAMKNLAGGTVTAAGAAFDLSSITNYGSCLLVGGSWNNYTLKSGTTTESTTPATSTVATVSQSGNFGCLRCHNSISQNNGYAERFNKESYLKQGHKNMLRKVTAGSVWAGPDADGVITPYTDYAAGSINWTAGTAQVGGVDKPLLYIFGDWMAPAPGGLDVVVQIGSNAKYNGTSNYSCAPCHTTGWSNSTAGLCSASSITIQANCTSPNTWTPSTGVQGTIGARPAADFPGVTFTGAGNWDENGIMCSRCHASTWPAAYNSSNVAITAGGHDFSGAITTGAAINNTCVGCHQSAAKTSNGIGADVDLANPTGIPVKNSDTTGTCSVAGKTTESACTTAGGTWTPTSYAPEFSGHVLGGSFLNSPHAKFTGTLVPNALGKYDISGTYASAFKGGYCRSSTTAGGGSILATVIRNNVQEEIKTLVDCNLANGKADNDSTSYGYWQYQDQGTCTTCHDIHNSIFVADQEEKAFKRECLACHSDGSNANATQAPVPASITHPTGTGTPFENVASSPNSPCEICHMPKATAGGFPMHLWRISTDVNYSTFPTAAEFGIGATATNKNAKADINGEVWVDVDLACGQCHLATGVLYASGNPIFTKDQMAVAAATLHTGGPTADQCLNCHNAAQGTKRAINPGVDHHNGACTTCHPASNGHFAPAMTGVNLNATTLKPAGSHNPLPYWSINTSLSTGCLTCHSTDKIRLSDGALLKAIVPSGTGDNHHGGHSSVPGTSFGGVSEANGSRGDNDPGMNCLGCHGKSTIVSGNSTSGYVLKIAASGLSTSTVAAANGRTNTSGLCMGCHEIVQSGATRNHHAGDCLTCHHSDGSWSGTYGAGVGTATVAIDPLVRTSVTTYCQQCHASTQGSARALIVSGTGDNHHQGSSTSTARSVAGCLYCHGEAGGVPFGGAETEVVADQPAGSISPCFSCHSPVQSGAAQDHHAGDCVTCHDGVKVIYPGANDPASTIAPDPLNRTSVTTKCLVCHATVQGSARALIVSGTGDNHHQGSSTSTARSVAGCLYCHGEAGGAPFGSTATEVVADEPAGSISPCQSCHSPVQSGPTQDHHAGDCLTCHVVGSSIQPGGTDPALYAGDLTKMVGTTVNTFCQTCHATAQGEARAIVPSGTGDNHHNGSSTSTARSLAGCLYCHGEVGGVKFGTATTAVMEDAAALGNTGSCSGACHAGAQASAGDHHTGEGLALTNNTYCLTCHVVGGPITPGGTDPALYAGDLTKKTGTTANAYCQTCHATAQGSFRAIVPSGTGDNHHNGSSTTTARSLAGCLYCHGEAGGVKFGTATTAVMQNAVVPTSCSGACHADAQAASGKHHTGEGLTPVNGILCFACHKGGDATTLQPGVNALPANWASCQACHSSVTFNRNIMSAAPTCDTCHNSTGVVGGTTYTNYIGKKPVSVDVACGQCHGGAMTTVTTNGASYVSSADLATGAAMIHGTGTMPVPTYARFTWSTVPTTDYQVVLNASTSTCEGTCTYEWSFAPADASGAIASGMTTTHTFSSAATVTVTLTATGANGIDHRSKAVTPKYVAALPTTLTMGTNTIAGTTATVGYSLSGGQAPYTIKTVWGDGAVVTTSGVAAGANTTAHTYVSAGTYTVSITAQDSGVAGGNVTSMRRTTTVTVVPSVLTVSGLVTRPTGTPVYNASVTLKLNGVAKKLAYTNVSGNFTMTGVAPGTYTISVAKSGLIFTNPTATISVVSSMVTPTIMSQN